MKSPFLSLHTAVADRLTAETGRKVYDNTPENEKYPYITMGAITGRDWSDKSTPGQDVLVTVHAWSQYAGKKEILTMGDEIVQALTRGALDLGTGFNAVVDTIDDHRVITDIDGFTRHAIITFRYLVEEQ